MGVTVPPPPPSSRLERSGQAGSAFCQLPVSIVGALVDHFRDHVKVREDQVASWRVSEVSGFQSMAWRALVLFLGAKHSNRVRWRIFSKISPI